MVTACGGRYPHRGPARVENRGAAAAVMSLKDARVLGAFDAAPFSCGCPGPEVVFQTLLLGSSLCSIIAVRAWLSARFR